MGTTEKGYRVIEEDPRIPKYLGRGGEQKFDRPIVAKLRFAFPQLFVNLTNPKTKHWADVFFGESRRVIEKLNDELKKYYEVLLRANQVPVLDAQITSIKDIEIPASDEVNKLVNQKLYEKAARCY